MKTATNALVLARYALLVILLPLSGCAQEDNFDRMLNRLLRGDVEFAHSPMLETTNDAKPIVLDARERNEFDVSHLENAMWVGYDDFDLTRVENIAKDQPIVVYCSVGYRSERIARQLIKAGYTDVKNLYGGIFQWVNSGHAVVNSSGSTDTVHTYNKKWSKWLTEGVGTYE